MSDTTIKRQSGEADFRDEPGKKTAFFGPEDEEIGELASSTSESTGETPLASSEHLGKHRQYWRDIMLGVNDGIVSTFLLVAGVAGGQMSSKDILLTAVAGALAGAISMFSGEFVATKSQNEVLVGEIKLEQAHVQKYKRDELKELGGLLDLIGITPDELNHHQLRRQLKQYYNENADALLKVMVALEFGVIEEETRSPCWAGIASFSLFVVGSLPSVLPFVFAKRAMNGLMAAGILTLLALIVVGIMKTWATRGNCIRAISENVFMAAVGAGIAYGVGYFFEEIIN